ncbi:unnamed protein product [Adineta ricciae]|uniref:NAD(+)--protein-arginine ADP-ribosyltransferase n=1 Tax=Adineta ricciae TaxID=249248 RepID=A0A815ZF17_ADIRI|nr:unnamed protein product [Adineta ricciae]CAF1582418.1 unnamed protein product [Adineta ricciae]
MTSNRFIQHIIPELDNTNPSPAVYYEDLREVPLEEAVQDIHPLIPSIFHKVATAKRKCRRTFKLTLDQSASIYLYSMPTTFFTLLNEALRSRNPNTIQPWLLYLKLFTTAIEKLPSCQKTIWRGIPNVNEANFIVDQEITWWSISSCTISIDVISMFVGDVGSIFAINAISGRNIRRYSAIPLEDEIILLPGTRFLVISNPLNLNEKHHIVHMQELPNNRYTNNNTNSDNEDTEDLDSTDLIPDRTRHTYNQILNQKNLQTIRKIIMVLIILSSVTAVLLFAVFKAEKFSSSTTHILSTSTISSKPKIGVWSNTTNMNFARSYHTVSLLSTGKVLVVGGAMHRNRFSSGELYNPSTKLWENVDPMYYYRAGHTATILNNEKVLIVGGNSLEGKENLTTPELFDPRREIWTKLENRNTPRTGHTASLLLDGRVLIAGGYFGGFRSLGLSETYDSSTERWNRTGDMIIPRYNHAAVTLRNGKVLVIGGSNEYGCLNSTELYDPRTGLWTKMKDMNVRRVYHTATLLNNGKVLVVGGFMMFGFDDDVELYDPLTGNWTFVRPMNSQRYHHTTTVLNDGNLLVAGGLCSTILCSNAEIYDPSADHWLNTKNISIQRYSHAATILNDGKVLIAGGIQNNTSIESSEIYG